MNKFIKLFLIAVAVLAYANVLAAEEELTLIQEEAAGSAILEQLRSGEVSCGSLLNQQYEFLGEYYMGQMVGESHELMNLMMKNMAGSAGEEAMHVAMGKRLSGCDVTAPLPVSSTGFMPMMQLMIGNGYNQNAYSPNMAYELFSGFFGILKVALIVFLVVSAVMVISGKAPGMSARDILKRRYAKGEITKDQYESMKKDLL